MGLFRAAGDVDDFARGGESAAVYAFSELGAGGESVSGAGMYAVVRDRHAGLPDVAKLL